MTTENLVLIEIEEARRVAWLKLVPEEFRDSEAAKIIFELGFKAGTMHGHRAAVRKLREILGNLEL